MKPLSQLHQLIQQIENKAQTSRSTTFYETTRNKQEQIEDLVQRQTNEFKVEIEKRHARSRMNHIFKFPETENFESSRDSSLEEAGIYNLHVQNRKVEKVKSILLKDKENNENENNCQNASVLLKLLSKNGKYYKQQQQSSIKQVKSPCQFNQLKIGFFSKYTKPNTSFHSNRTNNKVEQALQQTTSKSIENNNNIRTTFSNNSFYQNTQRSANTRNVSIYQPNSVKKNLSQHGFAANNSSNISMNKINNTFDEISAKRKLETESSSKKKQLLRESTNTLISPTTMRNNTTNQNSASGMKLNDTSKYIQIENYLHSAKSFLKSINLNANQNLNQPDQFIKVGSITGRANTIKQDIRAKKFEFKQDNKCDKTVNFSMGY